MTFLCKVPFSDKQLRFQVNSILIQYFETIHGGCSKLLRTKLTIKSHDFSGKQWLTAQAGMM